MSKIKSVLAREILDSRGNPTVEADVTFSDGHFGRAAIPSGASTGSHEAIELRDGDARYGGKGVRNAVANLNGPIREALVGKSFDQKSLDDKLNEIDGTSNKNKLGANATLGVSMAFSRAMAHEKGLPLYEYFNALLPEKTSIILPVPMINIINGGKHAANSADFQEYMIVPHGFKTYTEALRAGAEVFQSLKAIFRERKQSTLVGDEGGFAPSLDSNEAPIQIMLEAIKKAGYKEGTQISIGLDCAATEFYKDGIYDLAKDGKKSSAKEIISFYESLVSKYPIVSIEDGLAEDDWENWTTLTKVLGEKIKIVGDDLFVTNIERLGKGIEKFAGNSIIVKPNQIGTISETIDTIALARKAGYAAIVSHRSGETEDTTIADLAVGTGVGLIKTGSLSRVDRIEKYNQLLRIEEELGSNAVYAGSAILNK